VPNQKIEKNRTASTFMFISGCLGLITVTALDKLYWCTDILAKGYPDFSQGHLIRSIVICVSIVSILCALIDKKKPKLILVDNYKFPIEILWILGTLSISIIFLLLFIFEPIVFSMSSLEDGPIEWISALLSFVSCIIFVISFLKYRNNLSIPKFTKLSLALLALVFFIIGMEEVSWFQRVLNFETTKIFDGNTQNETNVHNFASDYFENAYYMGTCLFFVMLSFLYLLFPSLSNNKYLRLLIARPYIAVIGTIPCAYNFDMWNISLTQISFFSSLVILISFAIFSNNKNERYLIVFTIVLIVITQGLFLIKGEEVFMRLPEITEYKELFVPLVFCIYSLDVYTYINRVYLSEKN
jgi:hypothetical protein